MTAVGLLAEFASPEALLQAARGVRARGYRLVDAYTPYPVEGLDQALALRRSGLPWVAFGAGLFGAGFAFWLQWLTNRRLLPLIIGGRPAFAIPAFVIIAFETMVLFAAVSAFLALFWACRLPRLAHPLFAVDGFDTATLDRFWLGISADDPVFDPERTDEELQQMGALRVELARSRP
jgi:hypothetical protein